MKSAPSRVAGNTSVSNVAMNGRQRTFSNHSHADDSLLKTPEAFFSAAKEVFVTSYLSVSFILSFFLSFFLLYSTIMSFHFSLSARANPPSTARGRGGSDLWSPPFETINSRAR